MVLSLLVPFKIECNHVDDVAFFVLSTVVVVVVTVAVTVCCHCCCRGHSCHMRQTIRITIAANLFLFVRFLIL